MCGGLVRERWTAPAGRGRGTRPGQRLLGDVTSRQRQAVRRQAVAGGVPVKRRCGARTPARSGPRPRARSPGCGGDSGIAAAAVVVGKLVRVHSGHSWGGAPTSRTLPDRQHTREVCLAS